MDQQHALQFATQQRVLASRQVLAQFADHPLLAPVDEGQALVQRLDGHRLAIEGAGVLVGLQPQMLQAVEQQLAAFDFALTDLLEQLPLLGRAGLLQRVAGHLGPGALRAEQVLQQLCFAFRGVQWTLWFGHVAISCRSRVSHAGGSRVCAGRNEKGR